MKKLLQALIEILKNRKDEDGKKKEVRLVVKKTIRW